MAGFVVEFGSFDAILPSEFFTLAFFLLAKTVS